MTKLTLKYAYIAALSGGDGMYEITLACRLKDVVGVICEETNLDVEIKSKEDEH